MVDTSQDQIPTKFNNDIEELMRRIRILEERFSNLRKKIDFDEQSRIRDTKEIFEQITILETNIREIKSEISELTEKLVKLTEELLQTTKKNEFSVLSKYLEFWQPLNFLTRAQAEEILNEFIKKIEPK